MSPSRAVRWLPALSLALLAVPMPARANAWLPMPGEYYSEMRGGLSVADVVYNLDGKRRPMSSGGEVEERSLVSYNEIGWRRGMSLVIAAPAVSATRRNDAGAAWTATGLADLLLGLRMRLMGGDDFTLSLEADWKAPLGYERRVLLEPYVDPTRCRGLLPEDSIQCARERAAPRLGDAQQDVTGLVRLGASLPGIRGFVQAAGGYRYRFEDPGDQIVAGLELGFWLGPSVLLDGHYEGALAVAGSGTSPTGFTGLEALNESEYHRAGPRLVYRLRDHFDVFAGSLHTIAGSNVLATHQYYVGLAFRSTKLNRYQGFLGTLRNP